MKRKVSQEEIDEIKQIPKFIEHIHFDGAMPPEIVYKRLLEEPLEEKEMEEWFRKGYIFESDKKLLLEVAKKGKDITLDEVKERLSVDKDCRDLTQYLEKFALPCAVLQTEAQIEESMYQLFENLSKQNVIYAEVRFAPSKHTYKGLTQEQVVQAAFKGMNRAKKDFSIEGNLLLCLMRGDKKENNEKTFEIAQQLVKNKIPCGLDLAGAEGLFPTRDYKKIIKEAILNKIPITVHAGEADKVDENGNIEIEGVESIRVVLEIIKELREQGIQINPKEFIRIGHGVKCLQDPKVVEELRKEEIVLEVCPTSNLQTKAVQEPHPIEELYRKGLKTTINTDNDTVSSTNILEEYEYILENTKLTIKDIIQMNINAIRGAFNLSPAKKTELIGKIKAAVKGVKEQNQK